MQDKIKDYATYNKGMFKSMQDKLFFMYKIKHSDVKLIVDFGCADGSMIKIMKAQLPSVKFIGYDYDEEMLKIARQNNPTSMFTSEWSKVEHFANKYKTAVTLCSVIHEVYSYGDDTTVCQFWDRMFNSNFEYILIRDMLPHVDIDRKINHEDVKRLIKHADPKQLDSFVNEWGTFQTNRELVHFLYKYTYTDNWEREVRENYFAVTIQEVLRLIPEKYTVDLLDTYILPALRNRIQKDFDIRLQYDTHCKLILKLN